MDSSKFEAQARCSREQKVERKAKGRCKLGVPRSELSTHHSIKAPTGEGGSTNASSKVEDISKGKAQARCPRKQKTERRDAISPCFNGAGT